MNDFWFGSIPNDWKISPIKRVVRLRNDRTDNSELPYVGLENIESGTGRLIDTASAAETGTANSFRRNDVLFNKLRPYLAKSFIAEFDGVCTTELLVWEPRSNIVPEYLRYITLVADFITLVDSSTFGSKMPKADWDFIGRVNIPIPPLETQRQITSLLDQDTLEVDRLIEAKERLLTLLAEKRRALVTQIILSGTNDNVREADSQVEWIGSIPKHWEVVRGKQILCERDERSEDGEEELLTVSHITGVTSRTEKDVTMFEAESKEGYKICKADDFAVNTMWAFMGAMGTSPIDGIVSPSYGVYILSKRVDPDWFDMLVRLPNFCEEVRRNSKGVWSSRLRLYAEALFDIRFPLPPLEEQKAIVRKLRHDLSNAKQMEATTNRSIGLLQERRSALIAAAVTGQITIADAENTKNKLSQKAV